jgi:hypothetical protein
MMDHLLTISRVVSLDFARYITSPQSQSPPAWWAGLRAFRMSFSVTGFDSQTLIVDLSLNGKGLRVYKPCDITTGILQKNFHNIRPKFFCARDKKKERILIQRLNILIGPADISTSL